MRFIGCPLKIAEKTVVLLGCPAKMLKKTLGLLGCPLKMGEQAFVLLCFRSNRTTGQPRTTDMVLERNTTPILSPNSPSTWNLIASRSPTQLRLACPARTHERNETISRLDSPRLPPIFYTEPIYKPMKTYQFQ